MKTLLAVAALLLAALSIVPATDAKPVCVGNPNTVAACGGDYGSQGICAVVGFGLQGAGACVQPHGPRVRVCSTLYIYGVGNCPTDLTITS
ncbi:MAG: hypothetical protein V4510_01080 [bacterium]